MYCPQCGKQVPAEALFCGFCGHRMEAGMAPGVEKISGAEQEDWGVDREDAPTRVGAFEDVPSPGMAGGGGEGQAQQGLQEPDRMDLEDDSGSEEHSDPEPVTAPRKWGRLWVWIVLCAVVLVGLLGATGRLREWFSPKPNFSTRDGRYELELRNYYGDDPPRLQYGYPVVLISGWTTQEYWQADHFLDSIGYMNVRVNGMPLTNVLSGWKGIQDRSYGSEGDLPTAFFEYNLGVLEPGIYEVETRLNLARDHDDGFDVYSAGELFNFHMEFEVLEE